METPQNKKIRPQRTPTPKMSARKKALFERDLQSPIKESDVELGIEPLSPEPQLSILNESMRKNTDLKKKKLDMDTSNTCSNVNLLLTCKSPEVRLRRLDINTYSPRRSPRTHSAKKISEPIDCPFKTKLNNEDTIKENTPNTPKTFTPSTDELQILFSNTLNFKQKKKGRNIFDENSVSSSDEEAYKEKQKEIKEEFVNHKTCKKRSKENEADTEPKEKIPRVELTPSTPSNEDSPKRSLTTSIPTKLFYSRRTATTPSQSPSTPTPSRKNFQSQKGMSFKKPRKLSSAINKGVGHKIRRKPQNKSLIKTSVEDILKTIRSDKFKFLPSKRVFDKKLKEVHEILKSSEDPIKRARPLNIQPVDSDLRAAFSDSEREEDCSSDDETIPFIQPEQEVHKEPEAVLTKRRFFKSGNHLVKNQYQLTKNIKATVTNGKIFILPSKKKKKISRAKLLDGSFSTEQKAVDDIIQKLDAVTDDPLSAYPKGLEENIAVVTTKSNTTQPATDVDEFSHFRARIPYNTNDPEIIEQQQLLLDFLIANQICTEENFKIFIADPDNHKEEADKIVNSVVLVVPENDGPMGGVIDHYEEVITTNVDNIQRFRDMLPYNTTDPATIEQQKIMLDFLIMNQICTEENFKIFIADPENHKEEAALIVDNLVKITTEGEHISDPITGSNPSLDLNMDVEEDPFDVLGALQIENIEPNKNSQSKDSMGVKLFPIFYPGKVKPIVQQSSSKRKNQWNRGLGSNQYQIDAGQKDFGAKQCSKCGLVYTVHEPEEEKLHYEYHSNIHILKFKGWIDEDVIMEFPEWGPDGRIIKITSSAHPKRLERVSEVLKLVDQELGFSSYILPANYIVFFAIRRQHIVGFCLVQPLEKAHKYVCLNGVDCCTEESFPAKCGVSRIWVAPFHRRLRIASKLIRAIQLHTILGEEISKDKIAFSAPTVDGKAFAQAVTKQKDFLVYQ